MTGQELDQGHGYGLVYGGHRGHSYRPVNRKRCRYVACNVSASFAVHRPVRMASMAAIHQTIAMALVQLLARHGYGLVYGGGSVGLMGVIANAVLASGGEVIG